MLGKILCWAMAIVASFGVLIIVVASFTAPPGDTDGPPGPDLR